MTSETGGVERHTGARGFNFAPLGRGEAEIRKWVAESWDEDGDYYPVRKFPESRPCHGRDEIAAFLIDYARSWARYEHHTVKLIQLGDDRVLLHARLHGEGRESGLSLDGDVYFVLCFVTDATFAKRTI